MKCEPIKLNIRPIYRLPKGHPVSLSGAGTHKDRRHRRLRTRSAANRDAMKDQ
jgi:hypothetical protein